MNHKEKAEQLFEKFSAHVDYGRESGKACARMCVNEIIKALEITTGHLTISRKLERQELEMDFEFWEKVKQEIEKL